MLCFFSFFFFVAVVAKQQSHIPFNDLDELVNMNLEYEVLHIKNSSGVFCNDTKFPNSMTYFNKILNTRQHTSDSIRNCLTLTDRLRIEIDRKAFVRNVSLGSRCLFHLILIDIVCLKLVLFSRRKCKINFKQLHPHRAFPAFIWHSGILACSGIVLNEHWHFYYFVYIG